VAITDIAKAIRELSAEKIRQRITELEEERQALKVLLRSAAARERLQRQRTEQREAAATEVRHADR
jgi:hypothetical protein